MALMLRLRFSVGFFGGRDFFLDADGDGWAVTLDCVLVAVKFEGFFVAFGEEEDIELEAVEEVEGVRDFLRVATVLLDFAAVVVLSFGDCFVDGAFDGPGTCSTGWSVCI